MSDDELGYVGLSIGDFPIPIPIPCSIWTVVVVLALFAIGGLLYGSTSHLTPYQTVSHGNFTPYIVNGGVDYLQKNGSSTYFIIHEGDFSPAFSRTDSLKKL